MKQLRDEELSIYWFIFTLELIIFTYTNVQLFLSTHDFMIILSCSINHFNYFEICSMFEMLGQT